MNYVYYREATGGTADYVYSRKAIGSTADCSMTGLCPWTAS